MADSLLFGKRYENDYQYFTDPVRFQFVQLHQIGELCCEAGFEVKRHRQTVYEITYIVTGRATVLADGHAYELNENDVFVSAIGQTHEIRADRGTPLRFCYLGFTFLGKQGEDAELERFFRNYKTAEVLRSKALLEPFARACDELHSKLPFHMVMAGTYVEQIVTAIRRLHAEQYLHHSPYAAPARLGSVPLTVARYIDRHFRDVDDIRDLAADLGYSYTYLAHVFKERMGVTIGNYILNKKMDEAKWLLRTGRMNVSQIAARFQYQSVQSFSNSFKKAVGVSPMEYQAHPEKYTRQSDV
ncbi:MAG: helix-turn-helix transcriptional regulator [Clostridia bacterium]|nr:helix-turn-helix transcriptional regulator [Clostridia bacterium]